MICCGDPHRTSQKNNTNNNNNNWLIKGFYNIGCKFVNKYDSYGVKKGQRKYAQGEWLPSCERYYEKKWVVTNY